jgi:hypothetical protein
VRKPRPKYWPPAEEYWSQRQRMIAWLRWARPIAVVVGITLIAAVIWEIVN